MEYLQNIITSIRTYIRQHTNYICGILLGIIGFLAIPTPLSKVVPGLDNSWATALNLIPDSLYQFGTDVTFTYGPLGYLIVPKPFTSTYLPALAFWWITFAILIFTLGYIIYKITPYDERVGRTALLTLLLVPFGFMSGEKYFTLTALVLFIAYWYSSEKNRYKNIFIFLACIYMIIMFFAKLNAGIEIMAGLGILLIATLVLKKKSETKLFLGSLAASVALFLIILTLYTGSVTGTLTYLFDCIEIVSGYNIGMSWIHSGSALATMFGILTLVGAVLLFIAIAIFTLGYYHADKKAFWIMLVVLMYLFLEFKHGFIRADIGHTLSYFKSVIILAGLLFLVLPQKNTLLLAANKYFIDFTSKTTKIIAVLMICLLCIGSLGLACSAYPSIPEKFETYALEHQLLLPNKLTAISQQIDTITHPIEDSQEDVLPDEMRKMIGNSTITVMPWEINYMIYNDLIEQYIPTPTLQAYQAYTPYLEKKYEVFFSSNTSPDFIIVNFEAIDGGNVLLETPGAWRVIAEQYDVASHSGDVLLLKKKSSPHVHTSDVNIYTETFSNTDRIMLPHSDQDGILYIDMELTPFGKMVKTLFRIPPVYLNFTFDDGTTATYRVIPELLSTGMPTSLPADLTELKTFISTGTLDRKIVQIQFVHEDTGILAYYGNGLVYYGDVHLTYSPYT